jgi:hypothetical protein
MKLRCHLYFSPLRSDDQLAPMIIPNGLAIDCFHAQQQVVNISPF